MASAEARTVSASAKSNGLVDIKSLVLLAILLAAGFILNMTVGNALATVGIKPQFIIAAYALAIILTRANLVQSVIYAVVCVIQITTSIPGLNFLTETVAAVVMFGLCSLDRKSGGFALTPLVATFLTTLVSGALFAVIGTVMMGAPIASAMVKVPLVLGTAVFNAAVVQAGPLEGVATDEFDAVIATNVRAPFILMRETLPLLRDSKAAEIVNICSVVAHEGYPNQSAYVASKHALYGLSKSFANEVYDDGVRVHVIAPGGVLTDMVAITRPDLVGTPMIVPDDMADAVEYLLCHRTDAVCDEIRLHRVTKAPF